MGNRIKYWIIPLIKDFKGIQIKSAASCEVADKVKLQIYLDDWEYRKTFLNLIQTD